MLDRSARARDPAEEPDTSTMVCYGRTAAKASASYKEDA
jgi:hypothetical protein